MHRRSHRVGSGLPQPQRRSERQYLDVDWFVESHLCSTLGRGLEISLTGALLPLTCTGRFSTAVTVHVALPGRARLFKAQGLAVSRARGWAIEFQRVSVEDLALLSRALRGSLMVPPSAPKNHATFEISYG